MLHVKLKWRAQNGVKKKTQFAVVNSQILICITDDQVIKKDVVNVMIHQWHIVIVWIDSYKGRINGNKRVIAICWRR